MTDFAEVTLQYGSGPSVDQKDDALSLYLPTDAVRGEAQLTAVVKRPGVVRDALVTMGEILAQDLRRKASDRSDYLAYVLKQGRKATKELWEAQKRFLEDKYSVEEDDEGPLDPVLHIDSRGVSLEVFSADESAYARLHLHADAYTSSEMSPGTTYIPLGSDVVDALGRVRSYRETTLRLGSARGGEAKPRKVPYHWARAFAQVQAASTLPAAVFEIAPVDLYNVLLTLRMQKAKKPPRALRYELVPGEAPRLVLEPWDLVLQGHGGKYEGDRPMVVRTWGRRRLQVLSKLLPHAKRIQVMLFGAGLPAYYVIDLGDASLTLALSGWTDAGWAGVATFDLLVAQNADDVLTQRILKSVTESPKSLDALIQEVGRERDEVRQSLLMLMQRGLILHDVARQEFVGRPLFTAPLDDEKLKYRDAREAEAHRLLETEGAVRLTKVHDLAGEGVRIEGEVEDAQAHRVYKTAFTLDREGRTRDPSCTTPQFRRSGMKEGPTVPMLALRLKYAREKAALEKARLTPEGRKLIRAETRTLVKREGEGSVTMRVSLDDRRVIIRRGRGVDLDKVVKLFFATPEEARSEYFQRLDRGAAKGFIDASAAEA